MKKILIPIDGSVGSTKALSFAISLNEGNAYELILLNVQPSYKHTPNVKQYFSQEEIQSFQKEMSKEIFDHAQETINESSASVHMVVRIGDPGTEICEEAKVSAVDFIIMGYRGLGPVKRTILGSVATHVLHATPCPVTIVP